MALSIGQKPPAINLQSIDGKEFNSQSLIGKPHMISFFRFATCPFCNMRIHELVINQNKFADNFTIVAIFDAPLKHLIKHASQHHAPFPILADPTNEHYNAFAVQRSFLGVLKGMFLRFPTLIKGLLRGYIPLITKGHIATMPAEFLIDADGVIQKAYYGSDEGDHMPLEELIQFSHQQKK